MMVFFRTRLGKILFGKDFLKRESPTLITDIRYLFLTAVNVDVVAKSLMLDISVILF